GTVAMGSEIKGLPKPTQRYYNSVITQSGEARTLVVSPAIHKKIIEAIQGNHGLSIETEDECFTLPSPGSRSFEYGTGGERFVVNQRSAKPPPSRSTRPCASWSTIWKKSASLTPPSLASGKIVSLRNRVWFAKSSSYVTSTLDA